MNRSKPMLPAVARSCSQGISKLIDVIRQDLDGHDDAKQIIQGLRASETRLNECILQMDNIVLSWNWIPVDPTYYTTTGQLRQLAALLRLRLPPEAHGKHQFPARYCPSSQKNHNLRNQSNNLLQIDYGSIF